MRSKYPWLSLLYKQILIHYKQLSSYHAILLHGQPGNGEDILCYFISMWLLCNKKTDIEICGVCNNCKLMKLGNCPDFYKLEPLKNFLKLGIDDIRDVINNLHNSPHHNGNKVVWLPRSESMTKQASNALLKILEEPPLNTYFILSCKILKYLLPTIKSRCLYWYIPVPSENLGIKWLKYNGGYNSYISRIALRLCGGGPLIAKSILHPLRWQERIILYDTLYRAIYSHNMLLLLPLLKLSKDDWSLHWLLTLINDSIKCKLGLYKFLINYDKFFLINIIAKFCSIETLHIQWQYWFFYLRQKHEIDGVNCELLLVNGLLSWERCLNNVK